MACTEVQCNEWFYQLQFYLMLRTPCLFVSLFVCLLALPDQILQPETCGAQSRPYSTLNAAARPSPFVAAIQPFLQFLGSASFCVWVFQQHCFSNLKVREKCPMACQILGICLVANAPTLLVVSKETKGATAHETCIPLSPLIQ